MATDLDDFRGSPSTGAAALAPDANVVLVVLESVGARWTSLYGGPYESTPNLAREAGRGVVFDNFYAHIGRSSNALVAMLMSRYPKLDFEDITSEYPHLSATSLASVFHDRGYATSYMTSSDFAWAGWKQFLLGRGFDELSDYHALDCPAPLSEWGVEDRCLFDAMIAFIERHRASRFFLMAWTTQTHYPYEPTPGVPVVGMRREPISDQWDLDRYLNVLHESDRHLERFYEALRRLGLAERTLVLVTGDHGQAFGYPHDSYGQGRTAYEEDVHIPLVISGPGVTPGARRGVVGSQVDLAPTVVRLTGLDSSADWQGHDLFASDHPPRAYFYVAEDRFVLGAREANWVYLWDLRQGTEELYDLATDPLQQHNLAANGGDRSARLRLRLAAWLESNRREYRAQ
jgi:lipoteichoic acid synthase